LELVFQILGAASLASWLYLLFGRGSFWRVQVSPRPGLSAAKSVAVVIPARNEEAVVGQAIASLLAQDYPGPLHIFLVDDHSTDATVTAAGINDRLTILHAGPLPAGWTGKLWAVSEGIHHAMELSPDYILLTDADIVHARSNLAGLVARAEADQLDLASYMVKLRCQTFAERALIPAFVFFFFKLYPPSKSVGAAGGCILIRPRALERIGGIAAIRGELIDDCALAAAVKPGGGIWLGLTKDAHSIREYSTFTEILHMISRSAFTQLRHSYLLLAATVAAMMVIYLAPPLLLLTRDPIAAGLGLTAWLAMTVAYLPTARFYNRSPLWAPLLPAIALFYVIATIHSAFLGGQWKGRKIR